MYMTHFGSDTLTNLGIKLWQLVSDKIKTLERPQSSSLRLKLEPLKSLFKCFSELFSKDVF